MNALADDVWAFVQRYCRSDGDTSDKNSRFVLYYDRIVRVIVADCRLHIAAEILTAFLALVKMMVTLLHDWDDLIDNDGREPGPARQHVYNAAIAEIKRLLAVCGIPDWNGLGRGLDRVESYFVMEARAKKKRRVPCLERALWSGNCDFWMYDDLLVAFIRQFDNRRANWLAKQYMRWRRGYLPLDLALDNISDFADDVAASDYNLLRFQCCERWCYVVQFGVVERLLSSGVKHLSAAYGALARIRAASCHATWKLLSDYLEGEVAAVAFLCHHDFFLCLPDGKQPVLLRFVTKVFPWSRDGLRKIGEWLCDNLPADEPRCHHEG